MKKANKKEWYCKICGRFRANEKFRGKGHSLHVCKDCQRKIQEEQHTKRQVIKMEKAKTYERLIRQVESLIEGVDNDVGALANVSALLHSSFFQYFGAASTSLKGMYWNLALSKAMWLATLLRKDVVSAARHGRINKLLLFRMSSSSPDISHVHQSHARKSLCRCSKA